LTRADLLQHLSSFASEGESFWNDHIPTSGSIVMRRTELASGSEARSLRAGEAQPDGPHGVEPLGTLASGAGRNADANELKTPVTVIPDLPWVYEDDRVVLLIRDPRTLYTYWDFNPVTVSKAQELVPDGKSYLRVVMLSGSEPRVVREFEVALDARAYYLFDCEPNRDYRVEIVFRAPSGIERLIGRPSNQATLPNNRPSSWVEDRFAAIPLEIALPTASLFAVGRTSVDVERRLHARSYELSGGEITTEHTGDVASSSQGIVQGFGGRSWSGTLVRK
jgi:hypothetical protein